LTGRSLEMRQCLAIATVAFLFFSRARKEVPKQAGSNGSRKKGREKYLNEAK
jgi:hypothetical protein